MPRRCLYASDEVSYLEVTGEPFFKNTDKGEVTVYPARINCNLKSQTIEEIKGHRQKEILAMLPYLKGALHACPR